MKLFENKINILNIKNIFILLSKCFLKINFIEVELI